MNAPKQDPAIGSDTSYAKARESVTKNLHDARDKAGDAARRTADAIESNPLAVVAGGIALGAIAGALIPRSAREKALLAPLGVRLGETARQAFVAARDAGREELSNVGLTPDSAKERGRSLLDGVGKALASAGTAAAESAKATASSTRGPGESAGSTTY